jgi:SAM-dependent methyltransferase
MGEVLMAGPLTVLNHYGTADLTERVDQALKQAGLDTGGLTWSDLTPLDQFHVRGLAATKELAEGLSLEPGSTVIDVGCGLGGPARYLAATHGCRVTGIDLSRPFTDVARTLTEQVGLSASVTYRQADALDLPFPDHAFDHAWTQHVAMNISDKGRFYANIHRVLKPAGRLAIYDVVVGDAGPLIFPVPWARQPEISFVMAMDTLRDVVTKAGFEEISWADKTAAAIEWFAYQKAGRRSAVAASPLGIHVVMGPGFPEMAANLGRNLMEGRARLVQAIVRRI